MHQSVQMYRDESFQASSPSAAAAGRANFRDLGIRFRLATRRNTRHHSIEHLQHMLPFLLTQAVSPACIVSNGFTDNYTLGFLQTRRGSPESLDRLWIECKCHFYHTLPY